MVVCLERGADLHMAQLMPLSLASVKSRLVLPFWYRLTRVVVDKGPLNGCVCDHGGRPWENWHTQLFLRKAVKVELLLIVTCW